MREYSVSYVVANFHKLSEEVPVTREPMIIRGRQSNAVLLGEGVWIAINETLHLRSVPGMRKSIAEAIDDCASELD